MVLVFWGVLIVVVDVGVGGFDLVVDLVGWLFAAIGLSRLRRTDPWFDLAAAGAIVGAIVSVPQLWSGGAEIVPEQLRTAVESAAMTAVVFGVCSAVARNAVDAPGLARRARVLRVVDVVTSVAVLVPVWVLAPDETTGLAILLLLAGALVTFAVLACFLVLVWTQRRRFHAPVAQAG